MKKYICIILFIFGYTSSYSLDSLSYRLSITADDGGSYKNLLIGIHGNATDVIDTNLKEYAVPEFVPPDDLYAVMLITDSTDMELFWSYTDFRPIPAEEKFYRIYKFKIFNLGTPFRLSWPKMESYVDSAFLQDIFTGNIVNVNMLTAQSHYVENFSQNQFNILVYFNKNTNGISEYSKLDGSDFIYPNPTNNNINLKVKTNQYLNYKIVNELGVEIKSGRIENDQPIDVSDLYIGGYFVVLNDIEGNYKRMRFIKF